MPEAPGSTALTATTTPSNTGVQEQEVHAAAAGNASETTTTAPGDTASWRSALPAELAGEKALESFKGVPDVAKGYVELSRKLGSAIWLPKEGDKPDEAASKVADIQRKLGHPEKVEGYKVTQPDIRNGVWQDPQHQAYLAAAHKAGLTNTQAQDIYQALGTIANQIIPDRQAELTSAVDSLKGDKDWGEGAFDRNMSFAIRAVHHLGGTEVVEALNKTGAGNNVAIIKMFSRLGRQMSEDGMLPGATELFASKDTAKAQVDAIMNDPKGAFYDATHPQHKETVDKVYKLNQLIYNEG